MNTQAAPALAAAGSERLSPRDFARLARFIQDATGIKMPENKITMVEGRLRRRVRATGLGSVTEYCRYLFDQGGLDRESVHLINAVTTNKTDFFREPQHFKVLTETVLPEIAASRRIDGKTPLKIWSAAASTGAEAYTLAMVAAEFGQKATGFRISILATDICTEVLETGLRGIYSTDMIAPVPGPLRQRYLMTARDPARHAVRIVPELRSMVHFRHLNLMDRKYPVDDDMDVVFCRNILIYFDKQTQEAVLERLCRHIRRGGYLFLGHSESLAGINLPLTAVGNTVFRRD